MTAANIHKTLSDAQLTAVAAELAGYRADRRIKLKEIAERARISIGRVSEALRGQKPVTYKTLARIAATMGCSLRVELKT
ncbi:MAG: helix-turn-helix transcriptional regulator [Planctomycetota bacterium]|nr:helix-turn-helix transcriptional regulator [Planctomycetaceae bacterium]MDQ3329717.1 helix-turn-helix transcriptional regulator [Planctomycetota bacterium]